MAVGERGKVAVVIGVGARAGAGGALCRRFAREGLHTFVAGRTQAKIEAVAEEISASGGAATAVVIHSAHIRHSRCAAGIVLRCICDHRFGRQQQACNGSSVLQCVARHHGRIQDALLDHVTVFTGLGVVTEITLAFCNCMQHDTCVSTRISDNLEQRLCNGTTQNVDTNSLVFVVAFQLGNGLFSPDQSNAATGNDTLFHGRTS